MARGFLILAIYPNGIAFSILERLRENGDGPLSGSPILEWVYLLQCRHITV
jgi:hypothetical protein